MGGSNSSCFSSAKVDTAKPEDSIDDLDLSTKPIEKSSVLDATSQRSESSAVPGAAPIIWTWTNRSTIRYNSDIYDPSICGCCFMENGDLVLCDTRNQLIKTFSNTTSVFLPDCPFDVAALNDNTAVVTLPWLKKLQLITVLPRLQKGNKLGNRHHSKYLGFEFRRQDGIIWILSSWTELCTVRGYPNYNRTFAE